MELMLHFGVTSVENIFFSKKIVGFFEFFSEICSIKFIIMVCKLPCMSFVNGGTN